MVTRLDVSARVRIVRGGLLPAPWKPGATGTVASIVRGKGGPWHRTIHLVEFDRPQMDEEGDGPYSASEIAGRYLRRLPWLRPDMPALMGDVLGPRIEPNQFVLAAFAVGGESSRTATLVG